MNVSKLYLLALAMLLCVGCAHVGDEFLPPYREPCQVPIYVDGRYHSCVSREHLKRILDRIENGV